MIFYVFGSVVGNGAGRDVISEYGCRRWVVQANINTSLTYG